MSARSLSLAAQLAFATIAFCLPWQRKEAGALLLHKIGAILRPRCHLVRRSQANPKLYHTAALPPKRRNSASLRVFGMRCDKIVPKSRQTPARKPLLWERNTLMMLDWNEYQKEIGSRLAEFMKATPDSVRGYQMLSNANSKTTHLGEKMRQLISLAVAVTTRCDGCIVVHTDAALKAGATKDEIAEALGVAMAMNTGAALIYSLRVMDALAAKTAPESASAND
jgi:AhpD family alkylhydroperoxidase